MRSITAGCRRLSLALAVCTAISVGSATAATAHPLPVKAPTAAPAIALPRAADTWQSTHGAGQNDPQFNDSQVRYDFKCVGDSTNFKITGASLYMWAKGERIKGLHFKYRLVAADTAGQPQWWSNWSKNTTASFKQGRAYGRWMNAKALGQSFSSAAAWEMEVKLKYPRSKRPAFRYKYRVPLTAPQCGGLRTGRNGR